MANKFLLKKSSVVAKVPTTSDLEYGEMALNYADGKLYYKTANNTIGTIIDDKLVDASTEVDNVLYVAKNGLDSNNGKSLAAPFLTIKAALAVATQNSTIFVKSGEYIEDNPVTIPIKVAIIGDNLRTTSIKPLNTTSDIFYVNNGCYITGFTFKNHISPAAAVAFNPNGSAGLIISSPYVQNCSSITTTGCGMRIDGSYVTGLKSMVSDAYTQINQGGLGIHILNQGYAQLVSIFTICCSVSILCESGGQCSVTNSNTSFGTFGLKADGLSPALDTGSANGVDQNGNVIVIDGLSLRPSASDVIQFTGDPLYYTIDTATDLLSGESVVTLLDNVTGTISDNTAITIYRKSFISASGHTFEYVGSGTNLTTAIPQAGGTPIQENEIVESGGGNVYYTSTDHRGDFRIGNDLIVNRSSGTIVGETFDRSLFAVLTPYILAIEG